MRCIGTLRDVTARRSAERALLQSARRAELGAEVGAALASRGSLDEQLRRCAQAIVNNLDAAFARLWILDEAAQVLVLRASMGLYTHLDGPHGRVPVGALKIGLIAQERRPHFSNDVLADGSVGDKAWALREGMVSFAGYPLIVDERVVGVMALFARHDLGLETLHSLAYVADTIALGIDRKRSEEQRVVLLAREQAALAEAQAHRERLHTLLMQAPAVIAILRGPDHVFELANAHYRRIIGEERHLTGKPIREAIPELTVGAIPSLLDRVYASGRLFGTEVRSAFGRLVDGHREEAFFNLVFQPTFDARGRVDGILQVSFDVTDQVSARRRAEGLTEQLRKSEQRYRSVVEATAKTIWITSPQGEMVGEQPGWATLTGQTYRAISGPGVDGRDSPRGPAAHALALAGLVELRAGLHARPPHPPPRRRVALFQRQQRPCPRGGRLDPRVVRRPDRRHREEADRGRARAPDRCSQAQQRGSRPVRLRDLHDLKAPLRGIANLSQWVEEDLADKISDEGREHMRLLRGRVHRLEALINGILAYSRAGRNQDRPEVVNLGKLLREVVELLAPSKDVTVVIPEDLPTVQTEQVPLQQVLLNLIGNAIKYARKTDPRVIVTCSDEGDGYSFMIRDNGSGIAPEFHARIWIIFQTLEPRDKVEATGIGLSIVKKNRGEPRRASLDRLCSGRRRCLPLLLAQASEGVPMNEKQLNILLVEDDDIDVMTVQRAFRKNNIANPLLVASNGIEALEMLRSGEVPPVNRIVLLDINMPRMDGIEFLRELRADPALHSTTVVVLTTSNEDRDRVQAYELNVAGYLLKPVTFVNFVEIMAMLNKYWTLMEFP